MRQAAEYPCGQVCIQIGFHPCGKPQGFQPLDYKCSVCGNIVEVLFAGGGTLVCCSKPMALMTEKTQDVGFEKHVPVIEKTQTGVKVKVGSVPHPMEKEHYIEWIEIIADGKTYRQFLKPGDKPETEFEIGADEIIAREYCNLHGLWKA